MSSGSQPITLVSGNSAHIDGGQSQNVVTDRHAAFRAATVREQVTQVCSWKLFEKIDNLSVTIFYESQPIQPFSAKFEMFSRIPVAMRFNSREDPPWLMKGRAIPLVGISASTIEMLMNACSDTMSVIPSAR